MEVEQQGGPSGLEDKKILALVAYLQSLGTDVAAAQEAAADAEPNGEPSSEPTGDAESAAGVSADATR
jgi:hypothetical protein